MQFSERTRRQHSLTGKRDVALYPHNLQFYKQPPTDTITLEEFEELALERLKVLRLFERAGAKFNKNSQEYKDMIFGELRKQKLNYCKITVSDSTLNDKVYDDRRRDHISHFILRLAYCRREDLRRWFITQEVDLFRLRFISETAKARKDFMEYNGLNYYEVKGTEKEQVISNLYLGFNHSMAKVASTKFYMVPFLEVLDLVKNRKVFLENGYAYIPEDDLIVTVLSAFRAHLSHALAVTCRALPQLDEDTRLLSMLSTIHQRYIGTDYGNKKPNFTGEVSPEQIDNLSKTSFPLCMRNLHETLRKTHHLKYNGRLQYGLFLKGIGLSLEDAMRFWREEFTKVMDVDKFDKQYSYNIRYNYGKEGKRANFSPYSCMKIITSNAPGPGEHHGCPFKHSDASNLKRQLQSLNINSAGIDNILDLATRGHYQIACTRFFEITHQENNVDQGISHPNQYFEESQKILSGGKKSTAVKPVLSSQSKNMNNATPSQTSSSQNLEDEFEEMEDIEEVLSCLSGIK